MKQAEKIKKLDRLSASKDVQSPKDLVDGRYDGVRGLRYDAKRARQIGRNVEKILQGKPVSNAF